MNEEQRKWLETQKAVIDAALTTNTVAGYEEAINKLDEGIHTSPEP